MGTKSVKQLRQEHFDRLCNIENEKQKIFFSLLEQQGIVIEDNPPDDTWHAYCDLMDARVQLELFWHGMKQIED